MNGRARILVVDDEQSVRYFLSEQLRQTGYEVVAVASGEEALVRLQQEDIDLVLLDLKLQGIDGLDVMAQIARQPMPPMVIMLTAYASLESAVHVMRHGGCDYLVKPCDQETLLAAVERGLSKRRELLRRREMIHAIEETARQLRGAAQPDAEPLARPSRFLESRGLLLDREQGTVSREGEAVSLTPTELQILTLLMEAPGHTVSYAEMAMALYGEGGEWDEQEARQSLSTHLWRLRTKLGDAPDGRPYIANVRGRGYKFVRA